MNDVVTPCRRDPSGDVLPPQPCSILNLPLGLRELCGCFWFLSGTREQLLSWLSSFSSWTFWTECLLYSGEQWEGLLINFGSACQCEHWPCPWFWLPECVHVCISVLAWGSTRVNSMALDFGWATSLGIPSLLNFSAWFKLCFPGGMWLGTIRWDANWVMRWGGLSPVVSSGTKSRISGLLYSCRCS